jgi:aspartokinase
MEYEQLDNLLSFQKIKQMKIVKFGGKSLANGKESIPFWIYMKINKRKIAIVVSARGSYRMS